VESLLLSGEIDFGFDCGRPFDPLIRYKQVRKEHFGIFASPGFAKTHHAKSFEQLLDLPNLQYKRVSTAKYLGLSAEVENIAARFNDLSALREACVASMGWAILPVYTVQRELQSGALVQLPCARPIATDYFGVWWLRGSSALEPLIKRAEAWLRRQEL